MRGCVRRDPWRQLPDKFDVGPNAKLSIALSRSIDQLRTIKINFLEIEITRLTNKRTVATKLNREI